MIVIKIEIWPGGFEQYAKELYRGFIWNDATGTPEKGNYKVELNKKGQKIKGKGVWKSWSFKGFERKKLLAWDLLAISIVGALGPERVKKWNFK